MAQPWGNLNLGDRFLVMGLPTFGKSTLIEKLAAPAERVLFISPVADFEKPGRLSLTVDEAERYPEFLEDEISRVSIRVRGHGKDRAVEVLRALRAAERAGANFDRTGEGGRIVALDEVGGVRRYLEDELNEVFREGRHYGIVPIFASQVATDFSYRARKLASKVFCLGQRHPDEIKALAAAYGESFARKVGAWRKYEPPIIWTAEAAILEEET